MVCKQCGHKLPKGARVCPRCGWMVDSGEIAELSNDISEALAKQKKRRGAGKWLVVALIAAVLLLAVVIPLSTRSQAPEDTGEAVQVLMDELNVLLDKWSDENGFVPEEDLQDCLDEAYKVLKRNKTVTFCQVSEDCIYFECKDEFGYVYLPELEDYSAGGDTLQIATAQPFYTENKLEYALHDHEALDEVAQQVQQQYIEWSFDDSGSWDDDNIDDGELTVDRLLGLGDYKLILWHGHGGYSERIGYFVSTTIQATQDAQRQYYDYFKKKYTVMSTDGNMCFTEAFFENCYEENAFDQAVIYIGTCHSGETQNFARILLDKGAAAVYVNSTVIARGYNLNMMRAVGESLCRGETVTQALESAKLLHGESYNGTYVYCLTREGYENITLQQIAQILMPQSGLVEIHLEDPNLPEYVRNYWILLQQQVPTMGGSDMTQYYVLYDIDLDGTPECLIEQGWDDYRVCDVYTMQKGKVVYLGYFLTTDSVYYGEAQGTLTVLSARDGVETCRDIDIIGGELKESVLYTGEVDRYWFEVCEMMPLVVYEMSDPTGLGWYENPGYDNWAALSQGLSRIFP